MRLYGQISKVTPQEDGTVRVEGIASSEAIDDQGEIVSGAAMRAAIPDYMKYPALREMHQLSAAGTTLEADVGDDGVTRIVARVVDPVAISKVKNLVYRGFSIGGRVTKRDVANPKIITGIQLSEISLVDRPANPEAMLECWKASITEGNENMAGLATLGDLPAGQKLAAAVTEPVQIWHCGDDAHRHSGKAEAIRCIEKQAAGGANGGTQWEPEALAKGEAPVDAKAEKSASVDEPAEQPNQKAEPESQPNSATLNSGENSVEKSAVISPAEETAAEVETEAEVAPKEAASASTEAGTADEVIDHAAGRTEGTDSVDKTAAPPSAEPSAAEAAIAKAAEVAAAARAALNLNEKSAEEDAPNGDKGAEEQPAEKAAEAAEEAAEYQADPEAAKARLAETWGPEAVEKGWPAAVALADGVVELYRLSDLLAFHSCPEPQEGVERASAAVQQASLALRELVAAPAEELGEAEIAVLRAKAGGIDGWVKSLCAHAFADLAEAVGKAAGKHTARNQMLVDKAYECTTQCAAMDGCGKAMGDHLDSAAKCMMAAGAKGLEGTEKANLAGELNVIGKAGGHQALLDLAHFCLASMGTGACGATKAAGDDKDNLRMAHDHLCAAGANCQAGGAAMKADHPEGEGKLAKVQGENVTLIKSLDDMMELMTQLVESNASLNKRQAEMDEKITRIGDTELPPRGLARTGGVIAMTKAQDNGAAATGAPLNTAEDIARAVEAMPPGMEKAYLHMRLAHADPRALKIVSAAEMAAQAAS